ncbi:MAG: hypothetical protein R3A47_00185 [Polyangiales bacterium]
MNPFDGSDNTSGGQAYVGNHWLPIGFDLDLLDESAAMATAVGSVNYMGDPIVGDVPSRRERGWDR